jgi:hypothetical protein
MVDRLLWSGIAAAVTMPAFGFGGLILAVVLIVYWRWAPDGIVQQAQMPTATGQPDQAPDRQLVDARRR